MQVLISPVLNSVAATICLLNTHFYTCCYRNKQCRLSACASASRCLGTKPLWAPDVISHQAGVPIIVLNPNVRIENGLLHKASSKTIVWVVSFFVATKSTKVKAQQMTSAHIWIGHVLGYFILTTSDLAQNAIFLFIYLFFFTPHMTCWRPSLGSSRAFPASFIKMVQSSTCTALDRSFNQNIAIKLARLTGRRGTKTPALYSRHFSAALDGVTIESKANQPNRQRNDYY